MISILLDQKKCIHSLKHLWERACPRSVDCGVKVFRGQARSHRIFKISIAVLRDFCGSEPARDILFEVQKNHRGRAFMPFGYAPTGERSALEKKFGAPK
jgi:hypothetical protein